MGYYKATNSIGIKRKFGEKAGKQTVTFGGKRCHFSEEALRAFADDALKKLDDGESEAEVKEWADSRVLAEDA